MLVELNTFNQFRPQKGVISVRFSCKFSKSASPMQLGRFFGGADDQGQVERAIYGKRTLFAARIFSAVLPLSPCHLAFIAIAPQQTNPRLLRRACMCCDLVMSGLACDTHMREEGWGRGEGRGY